ncbi:MAG: hypothetical protein K2G32_02120, partial [Oscillospiraceae bacterium]|nr:hypothetical protein [Oscillospiraceae bacterium]
YKFYLTKQKEQINLTIKQHSDIKIFFNKAKTDQHNNFNYQTSYKSKFVKYPHWGLIFLEKRCIIITIGLLGGTPFRKPTKLFYGGKRNGRNTY